MGSCSPTRDVEPSPPSLEGEVISTELPGKSQIGVVDTGLVAAHK